MTPIHRRWLQHARRCAMRAIIAVAAGPVVPPAHAAERVVTIITGRGCEEVCQSFRRHLERQGPVRVQIRDTAGDLSRVAGFVAEARRDRPDLVATWGTGITVATVGRIGEIDPARHLTDIPVVYMYVGNPVESRIAASASRSGRPNVAGANTSVPIEAQLKLLRSYRKIDRIGMLINSDEAAAQAQARNARAVFEQAGIAVELVDLSAPGAGRPEPSSIAPALDRLAANRPDFLYYVGSAFTLAHIDTISRLATDRGLPLFSPLEPAYRRGEILLGLISPLSGIGQVAAFQAGRILFEGAAPGDLDTPSLTRYSVLINMRAARALGAYPPMKLLQFADVIS